MAMLEYNPPTDPWIDIVFEDDHILAVNKPSGLLSVPGRLAEHHDSMWSRLQEEYPDIQVVHRLDMSTSGLMVLAKNKRAESALKKQFQFRLTHKIYYARVWGHVEQEEGEIDLPLICDWPNRPLQKVCFEDGKPSKLSSKSRSEKNMKTAQRRPSYVYCLLLADHINCVCTCKRWVTLLLVTSSTRPKKPKLSLSVWNCTLLN